MSRDLWGNRMSPGAGPALNTHTPGNSHEPGLHGPGPSRHRDELQGADKAGDPGPSGLPPPASSLQQYHRRGARNDILCDFL